MVRWSSDTYFAGQGTGQNSNKETKGGVGLQSGEDSIQHRSTCDRASCSSPFSRICIQTCDELFKDRFESNSISSGKPVNCVLHMFSTRIRSPPLHVLKDHDWLRNPTSNKKNQYVTFSFYSNFSNPCCFVHLLMRFGCILGGLAHPIMTSLRFSRWVYLGEVLEFFTQRTSFKSALPIHQSVLLMSGRPHCMIGRVRSWAY